MFSLVLGGMFSDSGRSGKSTHNSPQLLFNVHRQHGASVTSKIGASLGDRFGVKRKFFVTIHSTRERSPELSRGDYSDLAFPSVPPGHVGETARYCKLGKGLWFLWISAKFNGF